MLELKNIGLELPGFSLCGINFRVEKDQYFVLSGPTGSGKTLIMEIIAGIRAPSAGKVFINGSDVTFTDPAYRRIGYVPQDYALIPFKTVYENIIFGLQSKPFRPAGGKKARAAEIKKTAGGIIDMLKIGHIAGRMPEHLSGGEKQRVALGRALAVRPRVLLLDEPLSAVDEAVGNQLMRELKMLHAKLGTAAVHICHREAEMEYLADSIGIIREGRLLRAGITGNARRAGLVSG